MLEIITGGALSTAAGLNAYVPLLGMALLSRFTELVQLPASWHWLENGWAIGILGFLLLVEILVDKFPVLDSVNDALQTVVRPASGGIVFAAGTGSETAAVADPAAFAESSQFWPFLIGIGIALIPHVLKAVARPILNALSAGLGTAVMSTLEDAGAVVLTLLAVLVPLAALAFAILVAALLIRRVRRASALRRAQRAEQLRT